MIAGSFGVPADAGAVALNVTVVSPTAGGFATVWPSGDDKPWASNLNYVTGDVVPNMVTVKLGADGAVELYASAGCPQMIIDVAGWYASGQPVGSGGFVGVSPPRALDTREAGQGPCVGSSPRKVVIAGSFGVPADAGAVALNVTVVSPTAGGSATVWPSGDDKPWASNLNYVTGDVVPNMVTVKLGADGAVELYSERRLSPDDHRRCGLVQPLASRWARVASLG